MGWGNFLSGGDSSSSSSTASQTQQSNQGGVATGQTAGHDAISNTVVNVSNTDYGAIDSAHADTMAAIDAAKYAVGASVANSANAVNANTNLSAAAINANTNLSAHTVDTIANLAAGTMVGVGQFANDLATKTIAASAASSQLVANIAQNSLAANQKTVDSAFAYTGALATKYADNYAGALNLSANIVDQAAQRENQNAGLAMQAVQQAWTDAKAAQTNSGIADYRLLIMGVLALAGFYIIGKSFGGRA